MAKIFRKSLCLLALILVLLFPHKAFAESFKAIDIEVYIDEYGVGHVKEVWRITEDEGKYTERYKKIENLQGIRIKNFKASVNDEAFSKKDPWDVKASFSEKAGRYGIVHTENGLELCWGVSHYGKNKYTLTYDISPLVVKVNDYDMIHYRFIGADFDPEPENISIKIKSYKPIEKSEVSAWGFGFVGDVSFQNGEIYAQSTGKVNYGHIMARFPKGTYDTDLVFDRTFKSYADEAIVGSDWENKENTAQLGAKQKRRSFKPGNFFRFIVNNPDIVILFMLIGTIIYNKIVPGDYEIANKKSLRAAKDFKDQYYHDIPYDGPIEDLYIISRTAFKRDHSFENFLNAFLLKWIYEGAVTFSEFDQKNIIFNQTQRAITINHVPDHMSVVESKFFRMLKGALHYSDDEKIDQKEMKKYMRANEKTIKNYVSEFDKNSLKTLEINSYVNVKRKKKLFSSKNRNVVTLNKKGIELYENYIKFRNYLLDYSLIGERDVNEVKLWDQFMIFAALYGISQEVYENFVAINPEYRTMSVYDYHVLSGLSSYTSNIGNVYQSFESSGSGGSSSSGGGGGGFGGGSGGGR